MCHTYIRSNLRSDYEAILAKCGPKPSIRCLTPYAPNDMMVRGGTFYAFQQNYGDTVQEYAAELAVRYFEEQSELFASGRLGHKAFECGPPENGRAWRSLVDEFFAGRDSFQPAERETGRFRRLRLGSRRHVEVDRGPP